MPDISKITLPSGNTYDIKDAVARQAIAGGFSKILAWKGNATPVVANIPAGVVVTYNDTTYTGTLAASSADASAFYLVYSSTQEDSKDVYDEYTVIVDGSTKLWEKIGDTRLDLADLGTLAYKDSVSLSKGSGDTVLGTDATFTTSVTPTTTNIKATASGAAVGADGTASAITGFGNHTTDTFVKSVSAETNKKLVTSTVPNVTSAGSASTWSFSMGTGNDAETLIISGANSTAPTLGTAITVATGATDANGSGDSIVTGVTIGSSASAITALGTPTTATCLTGVKVTTQPTVALSTGATAGTGVISVATGIASASTSVNSADSVKVAKYDDLSVSTS